jgi:hypothetical protein
MKHRLTPEDLQDPTEFELLAEVSHQHLKEFIVGQVTQEKSIIRIYSVFQGVMILLFVFLFTRGIVYFLKGQSSAPIAGIGLALVFSFTALVVVHELLHALAYLLTGARRISFGLVPKKFIFYALADRQVIASGTFRFVALAPLVVISMVCLAGFLFNPNVTLDYFFLGVMSLHSLFCAGDIAMLAFYNRYPDEEIFNYDNRSEGKTYFYKRKQKQNIQ